MKFLCSTSTHFHLALPYISTWYFTQHLHSAFLYDIPIHFHMKLPHNVSTQHFHTTFPHEITTQHCHSKFPHNISTQPLHTAFLHIISKQYFDEAFLALLPLSRLAGLPIQDIPSFSGYDEQSNNPWNTPMSSTPSPQDSNTAETVRFDTVRCTIK